MRQIKSNRLIRFLILAALICIIAGINPENVGSRGMVNLALANGSNRESGPSVTATRPEADAVEVAVDTIIKVIFDQAMDESTLNKNTFVVNSSNVSGQVDYIDEEFAATFTPDQNLEENTRYDVLVTTAVTSASGVPMANNYIFRFNTVATEEFRVIYNLPARGETDVPLNVRIKAAFNREVDINTIGVDTFYLEIPSLSPPDNRIDGVVAYNDDTKAATFTPIGDLPALTTLRATVRDEVTDTSGEALGENYYFEFSTGDWVDLYSPEITETSPSDGETNVDRDSQVTVTFNETMDSASLNTASFQIDPETSGSVSYDEVEYRACFTPENSWDEDTKYYVTITTDVQDSTGNNLDQNYTFSFNTGDPGGCFFDSLFED